MNKLLSAIAVALALINGAQAGEPALSADDRAKVIEALVRAGAPRPQVEAHMAWDDCKEAAVERFADQPEDARTVAEAAVASCSEKETRYLLARGHSDADLLARVMEIRAARGNTPKQPPVANPATH